ncbi:class I SAM-dependent methyltransferase [Paenibacillus sp. GCM10023248]|uniref:class I SAM-dependent methyltransferase n=1 Tax=Bacillales TaxID=1385 RepID=UPI00237916D8|nr:MULTISPECIES: class I SAM-dependent methyltransferase [Bacillales]MDD9266460.1 class I SAM-dependent methyltransferase [Paenibacillus sp. MAHUQ-63]MDR6878585.1 putative methyltransferase [Bacillus sp. 3255]
MGFVSVLGYAHQLIGQRVQPGDTVIDATLGNGVDTVFLAKLTGRRGCVYGFDIQQQALDQTKMRLEKELPDASSSVHMSLCSHALMEAAVPQDRHGRVAAVTFNLGYLPGADPATITTQESTLPALEAALRLLRKGGIVTIVLYSGHAGGSEEAAAVEAWAQQLPLVSYQVLKYQFMNTSAHAPYLLAVEKR